MEKREKVLEVRDLSISFTTTGGDLNAIRGVNLDVYRGETVAIVGESGSGKSVTVKAAMGIMDKNARVNGGSIKFWYYEGEGDNRTKKEVDLLQMPNSCDSNNGLNGRTTTLRAIRSAGIEPVGAFSSSEEFKKSKGYTMTEIQGVKVGFVAFTKGLGGRGMPAGSEDLVNILYSDYTPLYNEIDKTRITSILKSMEEEKPDITVALLHWGSEYNDDISKTQEQIVSLLNKNGVDVIIGTHPHTLQPIEFDKSAGTLVAYSLGDFFGDANRGATNYSVILDVEITKDENAGTTKVTDYTLYPIYTVRETECVGNNDRRVVRIGTALSAYNGNFLDKVTDSCKEAMEYALTRIDERTVVKEEEDK